MSTLTSITAFIRTTNVIAASDLTGQMGKAAGIMNTIAVVLFFFGLVMAGVMYTLGRTEYMKYGIVGAAIGGLAWPITKFLFEAGSGEEIDIELDHDF